MMKMLRKKRKGGFTLIELIVVIAILGILAAIAIPRLAGSREKAATSADLASVRTVESAISIALAEGDLRINSGGTAFLPKTGDTAVANTSDGLKAILVPNYLKAMPTSQVDAAKALKVNWADKNYTVVFE